jgi:hypothetical protein
MLKLCDTYDILDPDTKQSVGIAKEEPPMWAKLLRLLVKKPLLPTVVNVYETEGSPAVITLRKRPGFLHTTVVVTHSTMGELGRFKSKLFSFGGGFHILDKSGRKAAEVKGNWKGWNFKMVDERGQEMGEVSKKWAGIGKELFTTADNYMISLHDQAAGQRTTPLLLAAGLAGHRHRLQGSRVGLQRNAGGPSAARPRTRNPALEASSDGEHQRVIAVHEDIL